MSSQPTRQTYKDALLRIPRLELALVIGAWGLGIVFALGGLAVAGPLVMAPLTITVAGAFVFNLFLLWLDRREVPEWAVLWGLGLGNLVFLTSGVYLTGGFRSPFFVLYTIYLILGTLRMGWRGAFRAFALLLPSWTVLALLQPPSDLQEWAWLGTAVAAFLTIALTVGAMAGKHVYVLRESRQRNREMGFLRAAGRQLSASLDPQTVLAETLAQVNEVMDVEAASLALVDQDSGCVTFELAIGGANERIVGVQLEPGQGIVGHAIREGRPLLVHDVETDPRWHSDVDSISGYRTRSILCVPLLVQGQAIGALEVLNKRDEPFTEDDQRLMASLADLAAQCIENARLHDELQRSSHRLQEAYDEVQRLDELKSYFIRNVTHELRTPLALISGYVELILDEHMGALSPEQRKSLLLVADKTSHLTYLVNDIISLQTVGAMGYDFQTLALSPLLANAVDAVQSRAGRAGIELVLSLPEAEELPPVQGDAVRLRRVFDHLLDNALKFSPRGGTVRISAKEESDMLFVRFRDEGIGIPPDKLERIFDRFYQIDGSSTRRFGGTADGKTYAISPVGAAAQELVVVDGLENWVKKRLG